MASVSQTNCWSMLRVSYQINNAYPTANVSNLSCISHGILKMRQIQTGLL